jgi:hypothetical protein
MDKEFTDKLHDFVENQDREQLRRLMNMGEERETDMKWKMDYNYHCSRSCELCRYFSREFLCLKHDAEVYEKWVCDLYEVV